jgi:hypothetical protein
MAKTNRGKGLRRIPTHGRGACPICKATRVKVLYERTAPDGAMVKVCKRCRRKDFPSVAESVTRQSKVDQPAHA